MSAGPSISIVLNVGRCSYRVGTYSVNGKAALVMARKIDEAIREMFRDPDAEQLEKLLEKECKTKLTADSFPESSRSPQP